MAIGIGGNSTGFPVVLKPVAAPFPNSCQLGFVKAGSPYTRTSSLSSHLTTVSHFNSLPKRGRSMAPRSRQVMLSCPSSLPGHSDFPTPITSILPASPDLLAAYRRRSPAETLGSQVFPPLSVTACRRPYPGFPAGAHALCFPASSGLLPVNRGSAYIPALPGFSRSWTLPAIPVQP